MKQIFTATQFIGSATFFVMLILATIALLAVGRATSMAQDSKDTEPKGNRLEVYYYTGETSPSFVLVELFHQGQRLRSRQLQAGSETTVTWDGLSDGEYEVHCSQIGHARSIYNVLVSDKDVDKLTVMIEKQSSRAVGGGPTYDDLEIAVRDLQTMNLDLQQRIQKLEVILGGLRKALASE